MFMYAHPSQDWLQATITDMQGDNNLSAKSIADILDQLSYYVSDPQYVIGGQFILDYCFPTAVEHNFFTVLKSLYKTAVQTFESDASVSYPPGARLDLISGYNEDGDTSATKFPREYFRLKLKLAEVALEMRDRHLAEDNLSDILHLISSQNNQDDLLSAYRLILRYRGHGYQLDANMNHIVDKTKLLIFHNLERMVETYLDIALYYYSQDMLKELKEVPGLIGRKASRGIAVSTAMWDRIFAEVNHYTGVIHRVNGEFQKALKHLDMASKHYAKIEEPKQYILMMHESALLHALIGREQLSKNKHSVKAKKSFKSAQQWLDQAYNELHMLGNIPTFTSYKAHLDHTQGHILIYTKRYQEAIDVFDNTLDTWAKQNHGYHLALTHNCIGYIHCELKNKEAAIKSLDQAKSICEKLEEDHAKDLRQLIDENLGNANSL